MAGELVLAKTFIEIGYKGFENVDRYARDAVQVWQQAVKRESQVYRDNGQDWVDATFTIKPTKLQSLGSQLKTEFSNLGKSIMSSFKPLKEWMDDNAAGSFRKGASALLDFSRAGSPLAFSTLGASVELLKARIGTSFGPVILAVAKSIQDFSRWIKELDPDTKKMIATWTAATVAGAGLYAVFGNLVVAIGKFGIAVATWAVSNPLLTGLVLIAGTAAKVYYELSRLERFKAESEENDKRIMGGGLTEDDISGSKYASKLLKIKDAEQRLKLIREAATEVYGKQLAKNDELQDAKRFGFLGMNATKTLFTGKASRISEELTALNKEQSILNKMLDDAKAGKDTEVKASDKPKSDFALSGLKGLFGGRSGTGALDSAYSNLNNLALGMDPIQRQILLEQQASTAELRNNHKTTKNILELLWGATSL